MSDLHDDLPELHRPLAVERIGGAGRDQLVQADAAECAALARRMGIPAVLGLSCRFHLTLEPRGVVLAEGELDARLVRVCVVSLEEFEAVVAERFRVRFVPEADVAEQEDEEDDAVLDPESDDEIPYRGGTIDLGEAAAEQLALVLDPYPRRPDATLPDAATEAAESPFAALARLKRLE
ncbi:MAG: hypothetical protein BGP12_05655 [Rhodospirillales bacterium 70-18]|nr:MAG: hypothetical protein BGP12_05655 [Rhodospirillales bacterium 70-18]